MPDKLPTIQEFCEAYRKECLAVYDWAQKNPAQLDSFVSRVAEYLRTKRMGFCHKQDCCIKAWRSFGLKGKPTWKVLFTFPDASAAPSGSGTCKQLAAAIAYHCDEQCPAVQKAVDDLSAEFREGRAGLLDWLRSPRADAAYLAGGSFGKAWLDDEVLLMATGRTHLEWFGLVQTRARALT